MSQCCGNHEHSQSLCSSIYIDQEDQSSDEIFKYTNINCLPFIRSDKACDKAVAGKQEQFNSLTAFLDLSSVYGNGPEVVQRLRNKDFSLGYGLLLENKDRSQLFNLPYRDDAFENRNLSEKVYGKAHGQVFQVC